MSRTIFDYVLAAGLAALGFVCWDKHGASPAPISPVETSTTAIATAGAPIEKTPPAFSSVDATPQQLPKTPAENDPPWARRSIESKLLYYIQGQAEISTMEVEPIACRRSGCEIHVLDSFESAMPGPADEARGWQAVLQRLIRDEQFRGQFDSPNTSLHVHGDRILYISTLRRRWSFTASSGEADPLHPDDRLLAQIQ